MGTHCGLSGAAKVREDPYHHPGLNTRCFRSHGLVWAGGFLWRWDLTSPTTFNLLQPTSWAAQLPADGLNGIISEGALHGGLTAQLKGW